MAKTQQELLAAFAEEDELALTETFKFLMNHSNGRKFLWWLLEICHINSNPFSKEPLVMSFNCGEMNVGQRILARLSEVNPLAYGLLMKEQNDDGHARRTKLDTASREPGTADEPNWFDN